MTLTRDTDNVEMCFLILFELKDHIKFVRKLKYIVYPDWAIAS